MQKCLPWEYPRKETYLRGIAVDPGNSKRILLGFGDFTPGSSGAIAQTEDFGKSWKLSPLAAEPNSTMWTFGTNSDDPNTMFAASRYGYLYRSDDGGASWTVASTPIASGPTAGIFALAFRGQQHGLAVGGDFLAETASPDNFARTNDGGASWNLLPAAPPEYRSGATWVDGHTAIAVGPSGSDVSTDAGTTWQPFDDGSLDTVDCARPTACWASGANGRVAYLRRSH